MDEIDRRDELKERFIKVRGYWNPFWDGLLDLSPDFFEAYVTYSGLPWRTGVLEPKVKELIYIAIDASATHLYEPGLRVHVSNALAYGASSGEIMEVFQLASVIGMQTMAVGMPALLNDADLPNPEMIIDPSEQTIALVDQFKRQFGYWNRPWAEVLRIDPSFFEAFVQLSGVAWKSEHLEPRVKELINVAINAAVTHLYQPGVNAHVRKALDLGATQQEIFEVFQLTSVLGMHACTLGVPILLEELAKRRTADGGGSATPFIKEKTP